MENRVHQEISHVDIKGVKVPVVYEKNGLLPIVSMQIVFKASGKVENKECSGLANFCARVLNEGTKKEGSVKFAQTLEDKAIHFGVRSGLETLVISLESLKEQFESGVKATRKLLKDPNITDENIAKIKKLLLGKISEKRSDFDFIASNELKKLLFANTPLEFSSLGEEADIEKLTKEHVKEFIKSHLDITNAMIIVGGDIELEKAKEYIEGILNVLPKGKKRVLKPIKTSDKKEFKTIVKETEQAYIYFGSPFFIEPLDTELYKSKVAAFILGASGFGSRIMEEIRVKRGLAYSAYGRIDTNRTYSSFNGYLQTKNENKNEAIKIVKEVIEEFVKNGATKEELEQAKKFLLGSEPLRNETLSQRLSRSFGEAYLGRELGHHKQELEKIKALELEDLNTFIKSHDEICELSFAIVTNEA